MQVTNTRGAALYERFGFGREGIKRHSLRIDAGYVDAEHLVTSQEQGIDLVGPASENQHWQGRAGQGFDLGHFAIDWDAPRQG